MNKAAFVIIFVIIVAFALILGAASLASSQFGKAGEMAVLAAAAVALFIAFKKSKGEK